MGTLNLKPWGHTLGYVRDNNGFNLNLHFNVLWVNNLPFAFQRVVMYCDVYNLNSNIILTFNIMIDQVWAINNEKLILKAAVPLYDQTEPYNNRYGIIAR